MSGRARRVYHPEVSGPGAEIVLDAAESHHVARVLRLRAGDRLSVFDGRGGEWEARLTDPSSRAARLRVGEGRVDPVESALAIELVQGACRADRIDWVLQKGTEVGVAAFAVVPFARSEGAERAATKLERWRKIALEACKQSGRRRLPEVRLLERPPALAAGELGIVLDAEGGAPPLGDLLSGTSPAGVKLAVGPEGGFEPEEVGALVRDGWRRAGLGPRTLRTETAGPVAAAIVLHVWGDLGGAAPARGTAVDSPRRAP